MRTAIRRVSAPAFTESQFPLLESGDLPGTDSWLPLDALGGTPQDDFEPDRFGAISLSPSYDD